MNHADVIILRRLQKTLVYHLSFVFFALLLWLFPPWFHHGLSFASLFSANSAMAVLLALLAEFCFLSAKALSSQPSFTRAAGLGDLASWILRRLPLSEDEEKKRGRIKREEVTRGRWEGLIRRLSFVVLCTAASYMATRFFLSLLPPTDSLSDRPSWLPAGVILGVFYAVRHVYFCHWMIKFPIIQIVFTERHRFSPPLGSVEADRFPNAKLLTALEFNGTSFFAPWLRHLATYDLCEVAETNVDAWRRSALFDLSETYKRVIDSCVGNLNLLTERITAVLGDKTRRDVTITVNTINCLFGDYQLVSWSARVSSTLTARSRSEDKTGAAQLTHSNSLVVSSLLSCLLAVEALSDHLCTSRRPSSTFAWMRRSWLGPSNSYFFYFLFGSEHVDKTQFVPPKPVGAMEDVLKNCIYRIVAVHGKEMGIGKTEGIVGRRGVSNWLSKEKPIFGNQEEIVTKLEQFVQYEA